MKEVKAPDTPMFQLNVYDINDCGRPGDKLTASSIAVRVLGDSIEGTDNVFGANLVDLYSAFAGHACEYIRDVDPTEEGYRVIAQLYQDAYDKLPAEFVE